MSTDSPVILRRLENIHAFAARLFEARVESWTTYFQWTIYDLLQRNDDIWHRDGCGHAISVDKAVSTVRAATHWIEFAGPTLYQYFMLWEDPAGDNQATSVFDTATDKQPMRVATKPTHGRKAKKVSSQDTRNISEVIEVATPTDDTRGPDDIETRNVHTAIKVDEPTSAASESTRIISESTSIDKTTGVPGERVRSPTGPTPVDETTSGSDALDENAGNLSGSTCVDEPTNNNDTTDESTRNLSGSTCVDETTNDNDATDASQTTDHYQSTNAARFTTHSLPTRIPTAPNDNDTLTVNKTRKGSDRNTCVNKHTNEIDAMDENQTMDSSQDSRKSNDSSNSSQGSEKGENSGNSSRANDFQITGTNEDTDISQTMLAEDSQNISVAEATRKSSGSSVKSDGSSVASMTSNSTSKSHDTDATSVSEGSDALQPNCAARMWKTLRNRPSPYSLEDWKFLIRRFRYVAESPSVVEDNISTMQQLLDASKEEETVTACRKLTISAADMMTDIMGMNTSKDGMSSRDINPVQEEERLDEIAKQEFRALKQDMVEEEALADEQVRMEADSCQLAPSTWETYWESLE